MSPDAEIRDYLSYDPLTGVFIWIKRCGQRGQVHKVAGTFSKGYRRIKFRGRIYESHRLAWWWIYGVYPKARIDHKNMDRADNAISNLRRASRSQNGANALVSKNNSSGIKGACLRKNGKWQAQIRVNKKKLNLGTFDTPEEAGQAYDKAALQCFGEFAKTNFGMAAESAIIAREPPAGGGHF